MKAFNASGSFRIAKRWQDFKIEVAAEDLAAAEEKLVSTIGSRHKVKRADIKLDSVTEIAPGDVKDPVVQHLVGE